MRQTKVNYVLFKDDIEKFKIKICQNLKNYIDSLSNQKPWLITKLNKFHDKFQQSIINTFDLYIMNSIKNGINNRNQNMSNE